MFWCFESAIWGIDLAFWSFVSALWNAESMLWSSESALLVCKLKIVFFVVNSICQLINEAGRTGRGDNRIYYKTKESKYWRHRQNECLTRKRNHHLFSYCSLLVGTWLYCSRKLSALGRELVIFVIGSCPFMLWIALLCLYRMLGRMSHGVSNVGWPYGYRILLPRGAIRHLRPMSLRTWL